MEGFKSLPPGRQQKIEDAAMEAFGQNGYKKTSVSDIAAAAGISKSMIFHYFGTKKQLYLHLMEAAFRAVVEEVLGKFDPGVTDFFDRLELAASLKQAVLKRHPPIYSYFKSMYCEEDPEVKNEIRAALRSEDNLRLANEYSLQGVDTSKFKEGVDPALVLTLLIRYSYGYLETMPDLFADDLAAPMAEFHACVEMLRRNLYKPEYAVRGGLPDGSD